MSKLDTRDAPYDILQKCGECKNNVGHRCFRLINCIATDRFTYLGKLNLSMGVRF